MDSIRYLRVLVVGVPDVSAGAHAVVGMVARWLVDPLPAQVLAEVDVQAPHAAALRPAVAHGTMGRNEIQTHNPHFQRARFG